jgi:hypothetical protein
MLFGPGSILDAHTDGEKVGKRDLDRAVIAYVHAARAALATLSASRTDS